MLSKNETTIPSPPIQKEHTPWKEYAINILIAGIPASIVTVLIKSIFGIYGATIPIFLIFGGAFLAGVIRKKRGKIAAWKTIIFWIMMYFVIFIIIPMILIALMQLYK